MIFLSKKLLSTKNINIFNTFKAQMCIFCAFWPQVTQQKVKS